MVDTGALRAPVRKDVLVRVQFAVHFGKLSASSTEIADVLEGREVYAKQVEASPSLGTLYKFAVVCWGSSFDNSSYPTGEGFLKRYP